MFEADVSQLFLLDLFLILSFSPKLTVKWDESSRPKIGPYWQHCNCAVCYGIHVCSIFAGNGYIFTCLFPMYVFFISLPNQWAKDIFDSETFLKKCVLKKLVCLLLCKLQRQASLQTTHMTVLLDTKHLHLQYTWKKKDTSGNQSSFIWIDTFGKGDDPCQDGCNSLITFE